MSPVDVLDGEHHRCHDDLPNVAEKVFGSELGFLRLWVAQDMANNLGSETGVREDPGSGGLDFSGERAAVWAMHFLDIGRLAVLAEGGGKLLIDPCRSHPAACPGCGAGRPGKNGERVLLADPVGCSNRFQLLKRN
jgi:hypothetical protein